MSFYFEKLYDFLFYDKHYFISLFFLVILTLVFYLKIPENKKEKIYLILFILLILSFILWSLFLSLAQYYIWKNFPISKRLVENKEYFFNYAYFHFWRDWFYRLIGVLILILMMKFVNFVLNRDVFYDDEKIILPFLSMFFFFPYNVLFLIFGFFVLLLIITIKMLLSKNLISDRFSFKNYWIILAWIVFVLSPFIFNNPLFLKYKP